MSKLTQDNDHEFILDSSRYNSVLLENDPLNWDSDDKSYEYDKLGGGTLMKLTTGVEFIKDGRDFINLHNFGDKIQVTKRGKSTTKIGEDWGIVYQAYLDLLSQEDNASKSLNVIKVPFTQGGLYDRIKARYSDKYDLVGTKDAQGEDIGELSTILEQVQGREIFRRSVGEVEDGKYIAHPVTGADKDVASGLILSFKPNSDSENINDVVTGTQWVPFNDGNFATGAVGSLMFTRSDRYRKRTLNGKVKITLDPAKVHLGTIRLVKVFYKYVGTDYTFVSYEDLETVSTNIASNIIDYDFVDDVIELNTDEAMALVLHSDSDNGIGYTYSDTQLIITEDDSYGATVAKGLLPYEMVDRLIEKITGESGLLISNLLGRKDLGYDNDGEWALLGTSSGYWGRGFDLGEPILNKETGEEEPPKQFTTSFKEAFESYYIPVPLYWGIQKIKGKEYVRIEDYDFINQDFPGIRMGREVNGAFTHIQATNPIKTPLSENIFTAVEIGYEEGGRDYEEVSGLTSPHGTTKYNTSLNELEPKVYSKVSKFRADLEGYDLARRKQSTHYPDTDTSYDQKIFFRHLKKVGTQYFLRTWEDDFAEAPKGGIYSPNTTGNLLLSPFRCLLRHGRIIATGLYRDPYETLNWISSNCFSDMITKKIGGNELAENGGIENNELGEPYINGWLLKFDGKVEQSMIDEIEGFTEVNGEQVPNWFGRFEVMVDGTLQYGRVSSIKITGEGKHEIALI